MKVQFGTVLRNVRERQKLTQEELAGRCSLSRNYISSLERGCKLPGIETIIALAMGLGITVSAFIQEIEEHPDNLWLTEIFIVQTD